MVSECEEQKKNKKQKMKLKYMVTRQAFTLCASSENTERLAKLLLSIVCIAYFTYGNGIIDVVCCATEEKHGPYKLSKLAKIFHFYKQDAFGTTA